MRPTLLFDRSDDSRIEVSGAAAANTLNGLVTNDVAALRPGHGAYSAMLTPKGKIVADLRILALESRYLLECSPRSAVGMRELLTKYVNPRWAEVRDVTAETFTLRVVGGDAAGILGETTGAASDALRALLQHAFLAGELEGVLIVRIGRVGVDQLDAFDLVGPVDARSTLLSRLTERGARIAEPVAWETLRVESGIPEYGVDMDDSTLVQEANLDDMHAVSYTKGCYVGQETVARVHFRGHVNRTLRRLRFEDDVVPPVGTALVSETRGPVGDVRSAVHSGHGAMGIGMVRREIEDGSALVARWESGETAVEVVGKATGAIG